MTVLDAARVLNNDWIFVDSRESGGYQCRVCGAAIEATEGNGTVGHRLQCPVLSMPKIVAALEAAERVAMADEGLEPIVTVGVEEASVYGYCNRLAYPDEGHAPDCSWQALVAALKEPT